MFFRADLFFWEQLENGDQHQIFKLRITYARQHPPKDQVSSKTVYFYVCFTLTLEAQTGHIDPFCFVFFFFCLK